MMNTTERTVRMLGKRNGLEWFEVEGKVAEGDLSAATVVAAAYGIEPQRWGWIDEAQHTVWVQGPRIDLPGESPK